MKRVAGNSFFSVLSNVESDCSIEQISEKEYRIDFEWKRFGEVSPQLQVQFDVSCLDMEFAWHPTCLLNRTLNLRFFSTIAASAPVLAYCNNVGNSVFALALSETKKRVEFDFKLIEETANIEGNIIINLKQMAGQNKYSFCIYLDMCEQPLHMVCKKVSSWWKEDCETENHHVPAEAYEPMYSTWYSYHQQFTAEQIEKQCELAAQLGMKTVIVDDGWQTEDASRGYAYCGDWEVCEKKIPDMRVHVEKIHKIGMKYVLWYSVPFVGRASENWERFKDKILTYNDVLRAGVLDPRYPEVRRFLVNTYVAALKEWDLDGFKLDFIDNFAFDENLKVSEEMDYSCVEDAVNVLMIDIRKELTALKPDILIEFRQGYIGPNMWNFGNMFRVVDSPANYRMNRVGAVDIRILSKDVAVHSDMLMWNPQECVENAALQILNVIFTVIQFSMRIEELPEKHLEMVKFWLDFVLKNKELLQNGQFKAYEPQNFYPVIRVEDDNEVIICVYQPNKIIKLDNEKKTTIINANKSNEIFVEMKYKGEVVVSVYDCMGNKMRDGRVYADNNLLRIGAPQSGLCVIDIPKH